MYAVNWTTILYVALVIVASPISVRAQADINSTILDVFGSGPPDNQVPPPRNRGFATVVTPEPFPDPTLSPTILLANTADECTCVPYYLCDPNSNTIRTDEPPGDFDGFGVIDIRFGERSCQDVLDVCCKGVNRKEEPIVVKPIVQKPNRAAGCGIRNVGGLDFKLAGATVTKTYYNFYVIIIQN